MIYMAILVVGERTNITRGTVTVTQQITLKGTLIAVGSFNTSIHTIKGS